MAVIFYSFLSFKVREQAKNQNGHIHGQRKNFVHRHLAVPPASSIPAYAGRVRETKPPEGHGPSIVFILSQYICIVKLCRAFERAGVRRAGVRVPGGLVWPCGMRGASGLACAGLRWARRECGLRAGLRVRAAWSVRECVAERALRGACCRFHPLPFLGVCAHLCLAPRTGGFPRHYVKNL